MTFQYRRSYRGPLKALILDWAGTTVDYGSCAPAAVFVDVFQRAGVRISIEQARGPMRMAKRDHIREILRSDDVSADWRSAHGRSWTENDVDALYEDFIPLQMAVIADRAAPIPGVIEAVTRFRRRGLKIGSTTGYNRQMMEILVPAAAKLGYSPDHWVCATDVAAARPEPWMALRSIEAMRIFPMEACVKIGDTRADIEEGLNAGMWTVGVAVTGNEFGLDLAESRALSDEQHRWRRDRAYATLAAAGAHYVVPSLSDCDYVLDQIADRVAHGDRP